MGSFSDDTPQSSALTPKTPLNSPAAVKRNTPQMGAWDQVHPTLSGRGYANFRSVVDFVLMGF